MNPSGTSIGLILWVSCVDDCLVAGNKKNVIHAKSEMMSRLNCDKVGLLNKYIGYKLDWNKPVLLQSLKDKFGISRTIRFGLCEGPDDTQKCKAL